ncbi:uncharacterized protein C8A04DRAFT_12194 [Dichotomopilus funicola]|uniref:Uncharacterized protein n=1 Tax=Dichotomopilus funicola TaxID=1934379 RepID=A0AAN6ZLI7_9PEZI|nr:hypothetical protein C8A04DRAFT_12194 [Dichotomopilus funicola]
MSTAVAMALSPAPHDRPSYGSDLPPPPPPSSTSPSAQRTAAAPPPPPPTGSGSQPRSGSSSPKGTGATANPHKSSPPSASRNAGGPKIIVKKEPGSPGMQTARHRPRKLDLSKNTNVVSPATGRPMTARDGLVIQEVGIACLSPGFVPKDATEQEQLNRSMSVREHQRQIIEARLQQQSAKLGDGPGGEREPGSFAAKTPGLARKRGAPPGLSIVAPSHEQFANERVIQSAPLGQTFTGRHNPHPLTRHITNQPSNLASTSHIHHVPATQTNNRLPPIADVFGQNLSGHPESSGHAMFANQSRAPLPSPHHPPPPQSARAREYKSAEEAQAELAGGRPELLPKLVRYGGHQPPTPPSPPHQQAPQDHQPSHHSSGSDAHHHHHHHHHNHQSHPRPSQPNHADSTLAATSSRSLSNSHPAPPPGPGPSGGNNKRRRAEYEDGGSPPLGNGARPPPPAPTHHHQHAQQPHQQHPHQQQPQPQQQQHHVPGPSSSAMPLPPFGAPQGARRGFFGEGRDSPETIEAKKEEFLALCARAWDLIHS